MASLSRQALRFARLAPPTVRTFPSVGYQAIPDNLKIEEETLPDYLPVRFYPVRIGEIRNSRYQVVGKLGFGMTSTVWLSRGLKLFRYGTYLTRALVPSAA
jgi:hypothetical protein